MTLFLCPALFCHGRMRVLKHTNNGKATAEYKGAYRTVEPKRLQKSNVQPNTIAFPIIGVVFVHELYIYSYSYQLFLSCEIILTQTFTNRSKIPPYKLTVRMGLKLNLAFKILNHRNRQCFLLVSLRSILQFDH